MGSRTGSRIPPIGAIGLQIADVFYDWSSGGGADTVDIDVLADQLLLIYYYRSNHIGPFSSSTTWRAARPFINENGTEIARGGNSVVQQSGNQMTTTLVIGREPVPGLVTYEFTADLDTTVQTLEKAYVVVVLNK